MSYTLINPATEVAMETIEHLTAEETDAAIARAKVAQKKWAALNPADRAKVLRDFAAGVDADLENLAQLEVRNSGHPIGQARWEANHVRNVLEYYSASPERLLGKQIPV
ncbi:MAG: aldehyde dehydrogenase family protein, partial [Actinomycetes bacterium]